MLRKLWSARNQIDFALRSRIRWGRKVFAPRSVDIEFQKEMSVFLKLFSWDDLLKKHRGASSFMVADIGARNFSLAPVLSRHFAVYGIDAEIHGIEVDSFRRLRSFHTRHDYAQFFEGQTAKSKFHAMDFLDFNLPIDAAFLLNPFVTQGPHLHWGLPLTKFSPERLFSHLKQLLAKPHGFVVSSNPCEEEFESTRELADRNGFILIERHEWGPSGKSSLTESRIGSLWKVRG